MVNVGINHISINLYGDVVSLLAMFSKATRYDDIIFLFCIEVVYLTDHDFFFSAF